MKSRSASLYQFLTPNQLALKSFALHQIPQLMSWFQSEQDVIFWAGYNFIYPYNIEQFTEQLKPGKIPAYALVSKSDERLLGFGQLMAAGRRCHLVRIAVNPQCRETGLGKILVASLCAKGQRTFNAIEATLFVNQNNSAAFNLYKRIGFKEAKYESELPNHQSLFMKKLLMTD